MPAVVERPPGKAGKDEAIIRRQLAAAAGRIRLVDVLTGGLAVLALVLGYAAVALVLDKWLDLPAAVRKVGFAGLLLAGIGLVARFVLRPLFQTVNPLYAAKKVETTAPDAKNAVVNWVDLEDDNLPAAVKAAVQAKAAAELRDADLSQATGSKSFVRLGFAAAAFLVILLILFVRFSPTQFRSLVVRAFAPFSAGQIANRTRITLTNPAEGDVTVTSGQSMTVEVTVDGRLPPTDGPDRIRLRVRYSLAATDFEEYPLEPGNTNKDWQLRVPAAVIQNGCWYRVAGGDGETPEYKVTVRPQPLLTGFQSRYVYPAYLRLKPETGTGPKLEAYRGTKVTLTATTNRELRDGRMVLDGKGKVIPGTVCGDGNNALRFELTLVEDAVYRIYFTATSGEVNPEPYSYPIRVITDGAPAVTITKPAELETSQPANGRLDVDALATDDQGIDTVTLRLQLSGKPLAPKPYDGGKSFKRDADGSFPTRVETKDSVSFADLKDAAGHTIVPKEGDVLEYWVEAVDNCTVPTAHVGKSKVHRVKILAPVTAPQPQKQQQQQASDRKKEEQAHDQQQQEKFQKEDRTPRPQQQPEQNPDQKQQDKGQSGQPDKSQAGQPDKSQAGQPDKSQAGQPDKSQAGQPDKSQAGQPDKSQAGQPDKSQAGQPDKSQAGQHDKSQAGQPDKSQAGQPDQRNPNGGGSSKLDDQQRNTAKKAEQVAKDIDKQQAESDAKEIQQAAKDMASNDPARQQKGRETLEKKFGKDAVQNAEKEAQQIQKDLQSNDPKTREAAEKKLEKTAGKDAMDKAKKDAEQLQKDLQSSDPATKAAAEKKVEEMKRQAGNNAGGQQKPDPKEIDQAIKDMQSGDPQKQKQGQDKLEQQFGKDAVQKAKKEAEQIQKDLNSGDPDKKAAAEKKIDDMKKQAGAGGAGQQKPDPKEIDQAIKDMQSGDPQKQKQGQDKLEQQFGKDAVQKAKKEAEQIQKDLNSGDPDKKAAAEKKIEDVKKQAGAGGQEKPDPNAAAKAEAEKKEIEQAAKDMQSGDPQKQKEGRQKLEQKFGKDAVKQAEKDAKQMQKDLQSNDPKTREAAEKKLEQMAGGKDAMDKAKAEAKQLQKDLQSNDTAKKAAAEKKMQDLANQMKGGNDKAANNQAGPKPGDKKAEPLDTKAAENAVKDLASDDPAKQKQAKDTLAKSVGKDEADKAAKEAEKLKDDLKSNDPNKRGPAQEKMSNLAKDVKEKAEQNAKQQGNDKGLSPEEMKKWAEKAKDLNSPDQDKKAKAEKEFDDKFGKDQRQALQDALKDQKPGDPKSEEQAKKNLENWADKIDPNWRSGGGNSGTSKGTPLADDPKDRLHTHELVLKKLKDVLGNKELQKKLGLGEEDYDRLVKGMEKLVDTERQEVAAAEKNPNTGKPTINVNSGNKVTAGTTDTKGPAGAGAASAPPGYADAQRKFEEKIRAGAGAPDKK